jgi:cytochrome c oxidase subunit 2
MMSATLRQFVVRPRAGVAVVALLAGIAAALSAQNEPPAKEGVREIVMTAKKYEFSPSEIRVHQGDKVKLVITALDRKHGFQIEALNIERELPEGEAVTIEFTADKAGTFPFKCSKRCGFGHGKMKGELIVE